MNLAATGLGAAISLGSATALAALLVPGTARPAVGGTGTALTGLAGMLAGAAALAGQSFSLNLPMLLPLSGVSLTLDALGGLFTVVTGGVAVAAGVYGISYGGHGLRRRGVQVALPLFVVSLLLVPSAASVATFLLCWELMALASLVLVVAEHTSRPEVASAGRWYAGMTQLGFLTILIGLLLFTAHAGDDSFQRLRAAAAELPAGVAGAVFALTLAGFASKAGIVPLHAWLPRAHPEAPSHVSALMSAAMVNLGVYGIVRVGFDLLSGGPALWWLVVLGIGAASAVYGILHAALSNDLKRLLGYSTTENLGLVLVGIGAAGLFNSSGHRALAGVALAAALLHVVGHAAFKTVLFLSAGSVLHATGTRDLDALGGLRGRMPVTTALFGLGALAASALPPGTAFVSEWLLLQALVHGLPAAGTVTTVAMPVAVAAVALTAGLAVVTFVKAFGVGFLARPRGEGAERAHESPVTMLVGTAIAAVPTVALALAPTVLLPALGAVSADLVGGQDPVSGAVTLRLSGVAGSLSPLLLAAALLAATLTVTLLVRTFAGRPGRRAARLWDCGAGPLSARMEYTATSFTEPEQRVFDSIARPQTEVDTHHHDRDRYLVRAVRYRRVLPDRIERYLYRPVLAFLAAWGRTGRWLATGSVHRYLGYGFYTLCGALLLLAVTR
ncbi:formate hydrogenlyase subunit 3/multisubunit Na+/H+ antiporter MnhD subunit [Saccharomonospora amisosensis]|uniref:Formate hydrogenlyase subunit 3/multisubunit Na+/H+ antiporter MnhD subunit n=1 Tax=Saccharomonospora amisosensis TaxID=1128677 RepID=A0A7X5ZQQ6_9PSEU|nr:proton-conducting transporter membrane subunit [Saccharomonospora amisosensis]NIJ12027.1 formate hydrogenlyase subunit 3/multisubunit Na+/H+ antiporter MnhD subunit [Saccharomonospora amisosensis]